MAVPEGSLQYSLRIGDTVLLYAEETNGYVFSELASSRHNSAALYHVDSPKDPNLPNVHFVTFKVVAANKYKSQERLSEVKQRLKNREATTAEKGVLLQAQKDCDLELRENDVEQERLQGTAIVYGEKVQLLHTLTKKYLTVNTRITSRTENTNLRVELQSGNSEGSIFKILPRYKVRSVGDEVRYSDQVKFESLKTEGQFLHYSARLFRSVGFHVHADCHELNLSATESAFTIIPHYRPMAGQDPSTFRAGGTVRLFHREYECYIAAEGSFAEDPAVVEDVHCRKRHSDHGILKPPSTSANTYWQFEKERDPRSGEPLSWGERCRIKHLPTRKYLAVVRSGGEYKLMLKDRSSAPGVSTSLSTSKSITKSVSITSQSDLDTVFSLFPVIQEGDTILLESYARIKHLQTKTWLHLEKGKRYKRTGFDPKAPGLEGLEWDSAELYMLSATETIHYDDAFTLEQVEESLVDKFNTVVGIVPILTTHITERTKLGAPPLGASASYSVASALQELSEFLITPSARDTKDRQKLLRNLRVLELVMQVLKLFNLESEDASEQKKVCQACYLVIGSYLKGDSRKNENYLARFIKFFRAQVHMGLNAEEVMIEMVEDNAAIVSKMAETELDYMITELVGTQDHRIMEFLGNLCVCEDRPIPSNQNAVLDNLVYQHGKDVFYRMEMGKSEYYPEGEQGVMYFMKPGVGKKWQRLTDIAGRDVAKYEDYEFLKSQLHLWSKICKGNNARAIAALDKGDLSYITFEKALQCARDKVLDPSLRSKYVELIKVVFVDVGENRNVLESLSLSFVYDQIQEDPFAGTGEEDTIALTGVVNVYFPQMKDWILEHIKGSVEVIASHVEDNLLLAEVLSVLGLLVKFGYYDDKADVDAVLHPLVDVLNGFKDHLFPASEAPPSTADAHQAKNYWDQVGYFEAKGRYQETQQNLAMFAIKERAMEVMELFFNFRFYIRLQRFIYDFRLLKGDVVEKEERREGGRVGAVERDGARKSVPGKLLHTASHGILSSASGTHPPPNLSDFLRLEPGKQIRENPQSMQLARERLKFIFSLSAYFFEVSNYTSPTITSFPDILIDLSRYNSNELVQGSMHLLNRFYSAEVTLFQKAIQTQLLVTDESQQVFDEIRELLPPLRRHLSVDAGESQRVEIIRILKTFTLMCVLREDDEEPHPQNQNILYNYGVLSDVLNYILLHAKDTVDVGGEGEVGDESGEVVKSKGLETQFSHSREVVFVACLHFLKSLARDNIQVQRILYDRMDNLLEINLAVPHIAEVLTEVFTGGPELCLKVREEQVEKLFQMVASVGEEEGRAELILTLQAIAKVEDIDLPVKRNQEFIIKFFSKTREKFCDHLLGEGREKERWELLTQSHTSPDLQLLLAMTDLLASCSEGENLFIESVCQTVYSVEELLKILKESYLPPERKRPFARFLVWVYMNTGGDKIQSGALELANSKVLWDYLEHMAFLLSNIGEVLRVMPHSETQLVRRGLSSTSRKYSDSDRRRRLKTPLTKSKSIPFVTGNDGKLLPGLLLYFSDGMLPLLKSFYAAFFDPSAGTFDRDRRMRVSSDILSALLHLCDALTPYFTMDSQVKLYRGTVLTIMKSGHGEIPLQVEEQVFTTFNDRTLHCSGIESAAREAYRKYYSVETDLNETFNKFTSNYRLAYQGPNTAHAQIGARFDTKYSDLDDELKKPGDEYLPLGPSFQEHVACFAKPRTYTVSHHRVKPEAERLIKQLEISFIQLEEMEEKERQRQVELDVKSLQILRAIIHNEIMHIDPNLKEESPASFRKRCESRVQPIQNAIQDFGNAVSRVIPLLSHPNDEIVREVLAFLKTILFSGNRHVQEGLAHLLSTREERLFTTMQDLLTHAAITHRERQTLLAQMESRLATEKMLVDSFKSIRGTGELQVSRVNITQPMPTITVDIEVEDTKGAESIPLETITYSPPHEESSLFATKSGPPMEFLEASPLLSSSHPHTSTSKKKGKPHRRRASSKPLMDDLDSRSGSLVRNTLARSSTSKQNKGQSEDLDAALVDLLSFEDSSHVKLALQVLGLMCDGQYRLMQNYLREQRDNIHTINLVGDVALFIQHFYHDISVETVELVHLILQTLIEMCVGNYPNQAVIFNRQILEVLNSIFRIDIGEGHGGYTVEDSVNLKASAVELLEVMLEETSDKSSELVMEIAGALDVAALHDTLADFYEFMNDQEVKQMGFDDEAERGLFRTYHVLVHLSDYTIPSSIKEKTEPKKETSPETLTAWDAWEFCKDHSRSVEVFYRNMDGDKILTRVHFQFDPGNKFREDLVERVKWNVNRDSPEDKLRDFLEWMKAVKKETIHHTWLHKKWLLRPLICFPQSRYYILLFLSLLMNLFLLITFEVPNDLRRSNYTNLTFEEAIGAFRPTFQDWFRVVLYLFGAIHLFFSLWMMVEYFLVNWKNFVLPRFFYTPLARWHPPPEKTYSDVNILGLQTVYVVLFVAASILSLVFWGYFYCFCLLHIIVNNDILQRVLRSITKNGIALLWVAILGLVVLYIYSVVSFAFLHESFLTMNEDADLFCNTLFECLISVLRYGLIDNLGLVVPLVPEEWRTAGLRLLYDISFFIIVTTIGLNIVFGIIVDTFSELRDERYHIEQDKKAFCFICGIPSHEFERKAKGFDHHVKNDHNMWDYIYFSIYLDHIDVSDHNAIESFVYKMIHGGKLEYFPLLVALTLGKEEDETARHLEELKTMVRDVLDHFKAEEHKTTLRDKLQEQAKWEELYLGEESHFSGPPHKEASFEGSSH